MNWWIWLSAILFVVLIIQIIIKNQNEFQKSDKFSDDDTKKIQYRKKCFLTVYEKNFLSILQELIKHNLIVIPQINLATVIQKVGDFKYQSELYRNIDFGVFDNEYNLLLLIELNDSTHAQNNRQKRDLRVREIVTKAEIKLITFYTNKPNKPDYVIERILNELAN